MAEAFDVFIAYAGPDESTARELREVLSNAVRVFLAPESIRPGQAWPGEIERALAGASVVVAVLSKSTPGAYYQQGELVTAIRAARESPATKRVIPLVIDDAQLPSILAARHEIRLGPNVNLHAAAQQIAAVARELGAAVPLPPAPEVLVDLSHCQEQWGDGVLAHALEGLGVSVGYERGDLLANWEAAARSAVLVMVLPIASKRPGRCHRVAPIVIDPKLIAQVEAWVRDGHGLMVLANYCADTHHEGQISPLVAPLQVRPFCDDLVVPATITDQAAVHHAFSFEAKYAVRGMTPSSVNHPLVAGVADLAVISACTVDVGGRDYEFTMTSPPTTRVLRPTPDNPRRADGTWKQITTYEEHRSGPTVLVAAFEHHEGRVLLAGTWKLLAVDQADNRKFVQNALSWLAEQAS